MPAMSARHPVPRRHAPPSSASLIRGIQHAFNAGPAADLLTAWLPTLEGLPQKLQAGARVAHVGCAGGSSLILMAMAHPASHFIGFDNDAASIAAARDAAQEAGVAHQVRFEIASAGGFARHGGYDLVILSGGLLDLVHPNTVSRHVLQTLKPRGTWMILEPQAAENHRLNEILLKAGFKHVRVAARTPTLQIIDARP